MSGSNPFDFSGYGMGDESGQGGHPAASNPFTQPAAPPASGQSPAVPPPSARDPFGAVAEPFATAGSPADPFADAGASTGWSGASSSLVAARPPIVLLVIALVLAVVAGVVSLLLAQPVVAILCWVVAGPIAIGLLAAFVRKDTYARSAGLYAAPGFVRPLYWLAIVGCLLAIWAPAWRIADWVGRL